MSREDYIKLRGEVSGEILYQYYKEHYDDKKYSNFLSYEEFILAIRAWGNILSAYEVATEYFDAKFHVLKCATKEKILYI